MPRRSRPSHRALPHSKAVISQEHDGRLLHPSRKITKHLIFNAHEDSSSESEERYSDEEATARESFDGDDENEGVNEDGDADAPRVSQWVDEDELEGSGDQGSEPEADQAQLKKLQNNLSNLPFGALRKAQNALGHAEAAISSEDGEDDSGAGSGSDDEAPVAQVRKDQEQVEWSTRRRKDIAKRSNKHAPVEVTSKKPVTRLRQVVEVKKIEPRDPRFLSIAGEFKAEKFQHNYDFLAEVHNNELSTLRDSLKRARKMLNNAPRHLRDDYEAEVRRLELTVKRTESVVHKERMDRIQRETLRKVSKDEKEKRKQGKGEWYPKKSEKRELVTRARYEAIAAEGGKRAVKKVIEKRQKKISQKEKKSRPFPKGGLGFEETRKRSAGSDGDARKRRRVG